MQVILIGPINGGKSTVASLLADRLRVESVSLDDLGWTYFRKAGYDDAVARRYFERGGQRGALEYVSQFYPAAIARVSTEYPEAVIELGAGHPVHDDPERFDAVKHALAGDRHVVLLLPCPDIEESLAILAARESNPFPEMLELNAYFLRHGAYSGLATATVYTVGKSPEETCEEIMGLLT